MSYRKNLGPLFRELDALGLDLDPEDEVKIIIPDNGRGPAPGTVIAGARIVICPPEKGPS